MTDTLHIYTRVSTAAQEDGASLDTQKDIGITKSKELGMTHKVWNEGAASSHHEDLLNRPVLSQLLGEIESGSIKHLFHPLTFLWMNCEFLIYEFVSVWWWCAIPEPFFNLCEFPQSTAFCTNSIVILGNTIQQTLEEFVLGVVEVESSILRVEDNIVSL